MILASSSPSGWRQVLFRLSTTF